MAIIRFTKEEDKKLYLEWRKDNPNGYILNINTWNPKLTSYKNIIHQSRWCPSLDDPPPANSENPVTKEHHKLCSNDASELISEMDMKGLTYKPCGRCKPLIYS
jgi:hypothetical protein